jgi:Transposase
VNTWRAGYGANSYVRFGGRSEKTAGLKGPDRVSLRPYWNLLEGEFELLLVNAHHVKQVPGRKTDVKDCEWLADLLRHGLLRASFVPPRPQRELRELTSYHTSLIRERATEVNRVQKTLEGANIKLGSVASDVVGVSGRQLLATSDGESSRSRGCPPARRGRLGAPLMQQQERVGRVRHQPVRGVARIYAVSTKQDLRRQRSVRSARAQLERN